MSPATTARVEFLLAGLVLLLIGALVLRRLDRVSGLPGRGRAR